MASLLFQLEVYVKEGKYFTVTARVNHLVILWPMDRS